MKFNWKGECCFVEIQGIQLTDIPEIVENVKKICLDKGIKVLNWE